jgi:hypothetical protein
LTGLSDQLEVEKESIIAASVTNEAHEGITAFVARRRPQFRGGLHTQQARMRDALNGQILSNQMSLQATAP